MMAFPFFPNKTRCAWPVGGPGPAKRTTELRVIGLGYVKWSAEQPEMPEPDTGHVGAILSSGGPTDAIQEHQHRRSQYFLS